MHVSDPRRTSMTLVGLPCGHTVLTTSDAWKTDIKGQGHDPTRQDLEVERITPPDSIAARLNLDSGRTPSC
jgi:DNA-binding GntR family transcriptional regulator